MPPHLPPSMSVRLTKTNQIIYVPTINHKLMKKKHTAKLYAHLLSCYQQNFRIRVLFSVILTIALLSVTQQFVHSQSAPAKVTLKLENNRSRKL
jgi:hypothetical protein